MKPARNSKIGHWTAWQMETHGGKPFYLHTHLVHKTCGYQCNGILGFLLAHVIHENKKPLTLLHATNTQLQVLMPKQRRKLLHSLMQITLNLLAKLAARIGRNLT